MEQPRVIVIDHNEPSWYSRYLAKGTENGAATYSRDIVDFHIPIWQEKLNSRNKTALISTCPLLYQLEPKQFRKTTKYDYIIQYLHSYTYQNPTAQADQVVNKYGSLAKQIIFVSAYEQLALLLRKKGYKAIFVPMSVNANILETNVPQPRRRIGKGRVLYFGNITNPKQTMFRQLERAFRESGWQLDTLSKNVYNYGTGYDNTKDQMEAWKIVAKYEYGIGVGRCALEMMALGVKTMIAGAEFGGLILTPHDFDTQLRTNLNGRVTTFDRDIKSCIANFDESYVATCDSQKAMDILERELESWL